MVLLCKPKIFRDYSVYGTLELIVSIERVFSLWYFRANREHLESIQSMVLLSKPRTFREYSVYGTLELIVNI